MENETTSETKQTSWLKEEWEHLQKDQPVGSFERLPTLNLPEGKLTEIEIDFGKPFQQYIDNERKTVKKVIPVIAGRQKFNFWLNTKNPLYSQLIKAGTNGQTKFKLVRTGQLEKTRYNIVE